MPRGWRETARRSRAGCVQPLSLPCTFPGRGLASHHRRLLLLSCTLPHGTLRPQRQEEELKEVVSPPRHRVTILGDVFMCVHACPRASLGVDVTLHLLTYMFLLTRLLLCNPRARALRVFCAREVDELRRHAEPLSNTHCPRGRDGARSAPRGLGFVCQPPVCLLWVCVYVHTHMCVCTPGCVCACAPPCACVGLGVCMCVHTHYVHA